MQTVSREGVKPKRDEVLGALVRKDVDITEHEEETVIPGTAWVLLVRTTIHAVTAAEAFPLSSY